MLATIANSAISLVAFIFVLGVLVVLHEAGHFLAARLLGAPVEVFSVGFGRRLWGFKRGGTDYRISLVPLGGYVRIVGLGPDESDVVGKGEAAADQLLPRWKRALILVAGPLTNVVAAVGFLAVAYMAGVEVPAYRDQPAVVGWVEPSSPAAAADVRAGDVVRAVDGQRMSSWRDLEMSLLMSGGRRVELAIARDDERLAIALTPEKVTRYGFGYSGILPPLEPVVVQLRPGSPAAAAGIEQGDRFVAVGDQPVEQFYDLIRLISPHPGERITVSVVRGGERLDFELVPEDVGGDGKIGINLIFPSDIMQLRPLAALRVSVSECRRLTSETFRVIGRLITRKAPISQISGPLDIARISGEAARSGPRKLVWLMGLISLQLGILNLMPIPILDGGHLVIIAFESTIRRDLSLKVKERILEVGFYLLILLIVVVMFNDIIKVLPDSIYRLIFRG